ncbi:MAG: DUF2284 domain-containing protein [Candidatus Methanomethylicaceae archaeon]
MARNFSYRTANTNGLSNMIPDSHRRLLEAKAKKLGATSAIIVPAKDIVVEDRTVLKCIFGCNGWGSRVCPPYVPTVDEFREMLREYRWALLVDWKSDNIIAKEISENFVEYGSRPPSDPEAKKAFKKVQAMVLRERKERIQPGSLELEKLAWKLGYNIALATFPGMCAWCANEDYSFVNCAKDSKEGCHHPAVRRPCMMGVGIRLDKTLEKLKLGLVKFPLDGEVPKQYTLILIE